MAKTQIEWTDMVWNPFVGCTIISPGCTNCYAMRMGARIEAMQVGLRPSFQTAPHYAGTTKKVRGKAVWTGKLGIAPESTLLAPLGWRKPKRIFVNSMGDLHHEAATFEMIDRVVRVMVKTPQHVYQILTKRASGMQAYWSDPELAERVGAPTPLPNVWLGASAERQQEADERIPLLLQTPAAVRFVSAEPLLAPVDFGKHLGTAENHDDLRGLLSWIIIGGESGPGARPMATNWAIAIVDQCCAAGVACFVKQLGARPYAQHEICRESFRFKDPAGGDPTEWPAHLRVREFPRPIA